jgi:hypothetical protein
MLPQAVADDGFQLGLTKRAHSVFDELNDVSSMKRASARSLAAGVEDFDASRHAEHAGA